MGNCTSNAMRKKKRKGDSASRDKTSKDNEPAEDVMYASIDHRTIQDSKTTKTVSYDDSDYAIVNVPAKLQPEPESECSSKDECTDDYVLMG
nr:uncharacterized protein si:ch211-214p13.7 [Solea senegalensis]